MQRRIPKLQGDARRIGKAEWLGLRVTLCSSSMPEFLGMEGEIVDETLHTFTIRTADRSFQVSKRGTVFEVDGVRVDGEALEFRSWDRTKKVR